MKRLETISLDAVKTMLRRGAAGEVRNQAGWCVYVDARGQQFYVVDDDDYRPVPYQRISTLRRACFHTPNPSVVTPLH